MLWLEVYALSVADPKGPWAGFAAQTVADWLDLLGTSQLRAGGERQTIERTLCLAVLRGALLDLLATGDADRATAAVDLHLERIGS